MDALLGVILCLAYKVPERWEHEKKYFKQDQILVR